VSRSASSAWMRLRALGESATATVLLGEAARVGVVTASQSPVRLQRSRKRASPSTTSPGERRPS
jgi:hypothetical protein